MIIGVGVAFAVGLGAVTVLLLAVHAEVRRLAKHAGAAQQALVSNLRQTLIQAASPVISRTALAAVAAKRATVESKPAEPADAGQNLGLPLARLVATAAFNKSLPPPTGETPEASSRGGGDAGWNADRRLLVMRLSSRGKSPSQIAAALRIPEDEVDLFLQVNKLVPG